MDSDLIKESIREQGGLRLTSVDANTDDADAWVLKVQTVSASVGFWLWWFCCSTSVVCQGKCLTCHLLCIEKTLNSTMVLQQQLQTAKHVSSQRFHGRSKSTSWPSNVRPTIQSVRHFSDIHRGQLTEVNPFIIFVIQRRWSGPLVCPRGHKVAGDYIAMKSACHRLARVWHEFRLRQILSSVRPLLNYGRAAVHLPMPNVGEDRLSKHLATASNEDL